ncbi:MAG TPA: DUF4143 domain-containing protein [Polyangiaceae bacterium]|nr:DUF4143 domain-containing protein [Polyangiaceae bacterium]
MQTYLERDVRAVTGVRDLGTFRRFLGLVASRIGQTLNKTDLAAPLGVSVPTIGTWLDVLEVTGQIFLVPPYHSNFGKRLIKSPKLHFADSGLACHLLGIETESALGRSPFLGSLFEGFVAAEIAKQQINLGRARELYHFRDQQGLEVDFVVPFGEARLALVEAKAAATARPEMARSVSRLLDAATDRETQGFLVYRPVGNEPPFTALCPGIEAVGIEGLLARLTASRRRSSR